ncbi:hypothetical protein LX81_03909 [Palleronia aestuarii]|uniref:Uncharacterized protein n=1 Tax=Palleronia aestuarii TaxID=568105 RepID=A0A2W7N3J2_9RHOB|nr:hypothetical protein [Palleronia aestuarii]PZX11404.1 hypothetical protein LX81_03909 [Palleronia aestuarii]
MKGFVRPEVLAAILRWREAAIGLGAAGLGLWWIVMEPGLMRWVGVAFVLGGIGIMREGLARSRRPRDGGGAGVVVVTERQITYLSGPGGGSVSLEALSRVEVERQTDGPAIWHLSSTEGERLAIPQDAEKASSLYDALAALPGLTHEELLSATRGNTPERRTLWQRAPARLH